MVKTENGHDSRGTVVVGLVYLGHELVSVNARN
ncbi:MAG: hypothetical protein ACJAZO_003570 [Myxococcota bacterium]